MAGAPEPHYNPAMFRVLKFSALMIVNVLVALFATAILDTAIRR